MRRIALLALLLPLTGCGYKTWWNPPFTTGQNPNAPSGESENLERAMGKHVSVTPLNPEPGDLWPGPPAPVPTLQDIQQSGALTPGVEQPVPGSPASLGAMPSPNPAVGSSVPAPLPHHVPLPAAKTPAPPGNVPSASAPSAAPPEPGHVGKIVPTPEGTGVTTGGTSNYQTMTLPGGGTAIVVPNGNGTSTVIKPDGTIQTIPTPR